MRTTSINSKPKKVQKNEFAHVYSAKSKARNKYLPAMAIFIVLLIGVFALTNLAPQDNAQASTPGIEKQEPKDKKVAVETSNENDASEENCNPIDPKFGGNRSQICDSNNYEKVYECFDDQTALDSAITSYGLNDQTYITDEIVYREGEIEDTYRLMAAFKKTKCIINLTATIENKSAITEAFEVERINSLTLNSEVNS